MTQPIEIIEVHQTHITVHRYFFCGEGCLAESVQYFPSGEVKTLKAVSLKRVEYGIKKLLKAI